TGPTASGWRNLTRPQVEEFEVATRVSSQRSRVQVSKWRWGMRYRWMVVALCGMFGAFPSVANAHFTLVDPPSAVAIDDGGKGAPPCGEGPASNVVTKVQGGRPLNITLIETT